MKDWDEPVSDWRKQMSNPKDRLRKIISDILGKEENNEVN